VTFSTIEFFVFITVVLALLGFTRSENTRRNVLLVGSYFFYGWWDWRFCFLMFFTSATDYFAALALERSQNERFRRILLTVSLCANLGVLFVFKYYNFFVSSLESSLAGVGIHIPHLPVILPVGISFFTFHSMSYTIDVYWRHLKASRSLRDFLLFVSFFPQLVAGPIVRGSQMLWQFSYDHPLKKDNIREGIEIFIRGFMKKVLFADTLAVFADPVFAHPTAYASPTVWLAVIAYAGQIYYDFSGYSEMAIGCGRMIGFTLPVNFRHPYLACTPTEFWRRWHISLSTWLRDYLYIPLGGNRKGRLRTYLNLAATMLLGGLWHGASWTFVAWGALHGIALAADKLRMEIIGTREERPTTPLGQFVGWLVTFVFVLFTWVFFRSQTFEIAAIVIRKMLFLDAAGAHWYYVNAMVALVLGAVMHVAVMLRKERDLTVDLRQPLAWPAVAALLLLVLLFGPLTANPFIYFQF